MSTYGWMIRREIWERRAIWLFPAIVGGIVILAALFGRVEFMDTAQIQGAAVGRTYLVAFGIVFYTVASVYSTLYLLDCLYDDRRDRSILFWKSLPLSDTATVLSKLAVGLLVIPLVCFVAADVAALFTAFILSVRARSLVGGGLWQADLWLQVQALWLYVIATTAIWYLPLAGWLMVISAWARRAVMMWAVLPPLALYFIERWFLGAHVVTQALGRHLIGYAAAAFRGEGSSLWSDGTGDPSTQVSAGVWHLMNLAGFFANTHTWIAVASGAALIFVAIQLRLRRTEV
jgi:ABC-2 type transport system permease protein